MIFLNINNVLKENNTRVDCLIIFQLAVLVWWSQGLPRDLLIGNGFLQSLFSFFCLRDVDPADIDQGAPWCVPGGSWRKQAHVSVTMIWAFIVSSARLCSLSLHSLKKIQGNNELGVIGSQIIYNGQTRTAMVLFLAKAVACHSLKSRPENYL